MEMLLLVLLFLVGISRDSESRFTRWFGYGWATVIFGGISLSIALQSGSWWFALGALTAAVAHARTLFSARRYVERSLLAIRSGVFFALGWVLALPTALAGMVLAASLGADAATRDLAALASWGVALFGAIALADLFRVLVAPPEGAGPGWWKWRADEAIV